MKSYVYLMVCSKSFKIGKAIDVEKRYHQLKKFYHFDLSASYTIEAESEDEAYRIEKILHLSFKHFQIKGIDGDGSTEFFDISCIEDVLDMAKQLGKSTHLKINKGIRLTPKPQKPVIDEDKKLKRKMERYKKFLNFIPIRHAIRYVYYALKYATRTEEEVKESYMVEIDNSLNEVGERTYYTYGKSLFCYEGIEEGFPYKFLTERVFSKSVRLMRNRREVGASSIFGTRWGKRDGDKWKLYTVFHPEEFVKYFRDNEPKTNKERVVAKYIENFKEIDVDIF